MTFTPSTASTPPSGRRTRELIGYGLLIAYVVIVCMSLWLRNTYARENAQAREQAESWSKVVVQGDALLHPVSEMYRAGVTPALAPEARQIRLRQAKADFDESMARMQADVKESAGERDVPQLLAELDSLGASVTELQREIVELIAEPAPPGPPGAPRPPPNPGLAQLGAVEARYREAQARFEPIRDHLHLIARAYSLEQAGTAARIERLDLAMHALLLMTIGCTTFFLYRLARQVRMDVREKARLIAELRGTETKYRSIFDNSIEGIFQTTPDGRFITANKTLARIYGYQTPEQLIERLSDIGTQLYVDPGQRAALLQTLQAADVVSNFEFEAVRADGRMMWLRENVRAVRDDGGELLYLEGTVEDVSDRWWAEQRRRLQYATTRVLSEAATIAEARPKMLQAICEILEWDMGAVWDVDKEAMLLRCVEVWHTPDVDIDAFEKANARTTYSPGAGLAGEVWQSGEPKWIANLSQERSYENAQIAVEAGMGSAFGVPISVSGEVLHVLEFFSPHIALPDPELLQTLSVIATQLGHLIERKAAEEELRKSEMRKAAILQSALDCVISFDLDGRIIEFNPAAERAFRYQQNEAVGHELVDRILPELMHDGSRRGPAAFDPSTSGTHSSSTHTHMPTLGRRIELKAVRSDGTEFPAELSISRIKIDGQPIFTAYLRDITDRKQAERITSELAAVVANSNDAIIACDLEGVIRSWNVGAERIYGHTAEEAVGKQLDLLLPPDRLDEFPQTLTAVKRGESLANYETMRLRKDGKKISVSLTDSPIRSEDGTITGLSSIARDITDRKRLEEELLQSQKMDAVGRLAGGIAHDFNNILTAILGYSDLLIGQIDERQWMYKHLAEIRKAADFAASLTHQLLAFSRRQPLYLRVFNINDTVRNLHKMLQRVIGENIKIDTVLNAETGRLKADPSQLEQVLLNLCVNARDAMPTGGTITITTADMAYTLDESYAVADMPAGEYVKLTVSDTGTGIAPEVAKHIFEPFFTTKEKGQGTGLGLATCYGIVKQSGGYIHVESTIGAGSAFSIYLPRVEATGEKPPIRQEVGQLPRGTETILYVEDEITVRSLTAHVLRRLGYTVMEAGDGKQARHIVEAQNCGHVDLLFSDVVLPDAGGRELADWIRKRDETTRILFTSGYVDESILRRHGLEVGTAFLQKPFTPAELARRVREIMDNPEN